MRDFSEYFEFGEHGAKNGFSSMINIFNGLNVKVLPLIPENAKHKRIIFNIAKEMAKDAEADTAMVVMEAWTVQCPADLPREELPQDLGDVPGRVERLVIQVESKDQREVRLYSINRDEKDEIVGLKKLPAAERIETNIKILFESF